MIGYSVVFEYGGTWDRKPLEGVGMIDDTRSYKGQEYWHISLWHGHRDRRCPNGFQPD